jgi:DNA ligase 4
VDVGKGTSIKDMISQLKVVVEDPWSNYHLGGRENVWIKLKPDYMDELAEAISGMVIGESRAARGRWR